MIMIAYNEAVDEEVNEVLEECSLRYYTKITGTFGCGENSGAHLGDLIWPGRNSILLIAGRESEAERLLSCIRELRKRLGKEGIKAFVWNLEEIT